MKIQITKISGVKSCWTIVYSGDFVNNGVTNGSNHAGLVFEEEITCYDTPRGSVRCVPVGGTYDDTTLHGGPGGIGVDNCPSGYNYLGKVTITILTIL